MQIYLGETGLNRSWQEDFPSTVKCHKCGAEARIMFVAFEDITEGDFVCGLRDNGGKGDYWLHDCCAVAVYLCSNCFEPNAIINQA